MEFLSLLKLDFTLFLAIIGVIEYIKSIVGEKLGKKFWIVPPIVSAFAVFVMLFSLSDLSFKTFLYNWFSYTGTSVILYEVIIKAIQIKIEQIKKNQNS